MDKPKQKLPTRDVLVALFFVPICILGVIISTILCWAEERGYEFGNFYKRGIGYNYFSNYSSGDSGMFDL